MKSTLSLSSLLFGFILSSPALAQTETPKEFLPPAPAGKEWKLIWHDEFDGAKLDESKWNRLGDSKRRDGWWIKEDAYLKLTEEIGTWGGDIKKAELPDYFEVDYVRVYELSE